MSRFRRLLTLALVLLPVLISSSCGGNKGGSTSTTAANSAVTVTLYQTSPTIDGGQSVALDASLMMDTNSQGVIFTLSGPGVLTYPTASVLSSPKLSCYYTPPAVVTTKFTATIMATSVRDTSKSAMATVIVYPTVTFAKVDPPQGFVGKPYSLQLQGGGGSGPINYVLVTFGSLAPGLKLDTTTGVISGTPTAMGSYAVSIQAQDTSGVYTSAAQQDFTIEVN